jgi:hypothetical protein
MLGEMGAFSLIDFIPCSLRHQMISIFAAKKADNSNCHANLGRAAASCEPIRLLQTFAR